MIQNVWLLRPLPHGSNQMGYFLEQDRIAVGYPLEKKNLQGLGYQEIRDLLKEKGWESGIGNVNRLVREMRPHDVVVIPDDNSRDVYFAEITSEYIYEEDLDEDVVGSGFPHQRAVKFFFDKQPVPRQELPERLLESLRYPGAVADLSKHAEIVEDILKGPRLGTKRQLNATFDQLLNVKLAHVLSRALDHEDIEIALRAAEILLRYTRR